MTNEIDSKMILGAALLLGIVGLFSWRSLAFRILKHLIRRKFPTVQWLTTQELAQWQNSQKPQPVLLDARDAAEYQLSHLQQAQRIDPQQPDLSDLTQSQDTPIVVYCSVGYRSAKIATKLAEAGYKHVYNLEGSIFQWINEGRPVFQDSNQTTQVHPYDRRWGQLLKSKYRAKLETEE
ncbi:rhodanese-like domain-containing protein [Gloeocapsopsis dulcis]|uniref:Sulfurtransferase n=1 Tax=Gloeocapsopsis dulcis AAB1 = 1H9 TaxID=1433147 RepID=A0A6N8FY88_9CHRO|nr:rhodanese-like domain-containing protein [Gloeocapsopsis dulcis]MUL38043.1 sulfurtransferase [Gloeocapsopsis dulcis AAB1 = 1H9]WNN91732.1 rhodanese-like domain-containing protein [Gloeocapsopsis dulcis]